MLCWTVWMSIFDSENVLPTVSYPPLQCKHSEHTWHGTPSKLTFEEFVHKSSYRKALLRVYIYMYIAYITISLYTIIYEIHIFQMFTGHVSEPVWVWHLRRQRWQLHCHVWLLKGTNHCYQAAYLIPNGNVTQSYMERKDPKNIFFCQSNLK